MKKSEIREINKKKRNELGESDVIVKSKLASERFLESEFYKNAECIMLYKRLGNETDTEYIIKMAQKDKKRIVFPVTERESGIITPYYANERTTFKKGSFSVYEPETGEIAEKSHIDLVLIPGIAFDKNGARVGFGKGCYDMFLKDFDGIKVGFCYDFQVENEIASDEFDINMDFIITENAVYDCGGRKI